VTPDVDELCAAGERAFENDEFEEAEAWYELACTGRYRDPRPGVRSYVSLIAGRFVRWEQLRAMTYQRSVRRLAQPDPGHVLVIQTCAGRESAFERLFAAVEDRWHTWCWGERDHAGQGQARTLFQALATAAAAPGFTALTLLEDDIVLAKNALDYIATTRIDPDLGFISWFSTTRFVGPRLPPLLHCIEARDYQFNQAITFPARTVHELLASPALRDWSEPHGADRLYAQVFPDRKVAIHYPNLVQHVGGEDSLVGNNAHGPRTSPSFIGEDADALELLVK
jgi:hypothetical protein